MKPIFLMVIGIIGIVCTIAAGVEAFEHQPKPHPIVWEIMSVSGAAYGLQAPVRVGEGWEPFSVTTPQNSGTTNVWLRRKRPHS